jgi:hypothetical protein
MKTTITILLLSCIGAGVKAQTTDRADFEKAVKEVITAFKKKDNKVIKKYIDKENGVYILQRPGVFDNYYHYTSLDLTTKEYPQSVAAYKGNTGFTLRYPAKMPTYSCDTEKWSKTGAFADTSGKDKLLSTTAKNLVKYEVKEVPQKEIKKLEAFEKGARRIVFADGETDYVVFYLVWRKSKWVLAIIDAVTGDCSA